MAPRLAFITGSLLIAVPAAAQTVTIENFVGSLDIREGSRMEIEGAPDVSYSGGDALIDGDMKLRNVSCYSRNGGEPTIKIGRTKKKLSEYPSLAVTLPSDGTLVIRDSLIYGQASNLGEADIALPSCGRLELSDVSGLLRVRVSGSADVSAGGVGEADLATSGSGDFAIGRVDGKASLRTTGSGDYEIGRIGNGMDFRSTGSGDAEIDEVNGEVAITTTGSGDVQIERGDVTTMTIRTTGSGDVLTGADVVDLSAVTTGSGDVSVARHSGKIKATKTGSGDIRVGDIEID